jgi:M6 family metalloprotease-like protein
VCAAGAGCKNTRLLGRVFEGGLMKKIRRATSLALAITLLLGSPAVSAPFMQTSAVSATPLPSDNQSCKVKEDSYYRNLESRRPIGFTGNATAFPFNPTSLPIEGTIRVAFVYVDWADLKGSKADYNYYKKQLKKFKDFYFMASEQKLIMNTQLSSNWFRIPGSYKDFTITQEEEAQYGQAPRKQKFYDAAISASDASVDYSDIDIVFFGIPRAKSVFFHGGPHEFNWNYNAYLKTDEGNIYDTATAGDWFLKNDTYEPPWVYYVHETGHMIGIPHQSNSEYPDGRVVELSSPMGGFEIMGNQGGATRTISSWLRWLAGWLDDDQIACRVSENLKDETFKLRPINRFTGKTEALVIKLDESKVVVVESRRFDPNFDRFTFNSRKGVLVYTVDANKGSAEGNMALVSPRDISEYIYEPTWRDQYDLDAVLRKGDSVRIGDIVITVKRLGKKFDLVDLKVRKPIVP